MNSRTGSGFMSLLYVIELCNFFESHDLTKGDEYALVMFVLWYWSILIIIIKIVTTRIIIIIMEYNAGYESRFDGHSFQADLP